MYKVIAEAPTVYQLNSVRQFGNPVVHYGNGTHVFTRSFVSREQAKEYLKERAMLYFDEEENELEKALSDIEDNGVLRIDAVQGRIERVDAW